MIGLEIYANQTFTEMVAIDIPSEYSYIIYTFIASIFVLQYLGIKVGRARRTYKVDYPTMYDNDKPLFNCVQRGHQNFLESYPFFLVLLFVSGLVEPVYASIAGIIHLIGRIIFAELYATGDPKKRTGAAIFIYPTLFYLLFLTGYFGYSLQ